MIKRVLTIAGSDCGGGAGIQADLKTFQAFGVYGMSVVTAVTAQNTLNVNGIEGISAEFVSLQIESVLADIGVDSVKTGMLFSADIVRVVSGKFGESNVPLVVDPVMVSKGGRLLLNPDGAAAVKKYLIPVATLVTPNIPEAEFLSGNAIKSLKDMARAARVIHGLGCQAVLVKGGHFSGDAIDILYDGHQVVQLSTPRIDTRHTHGTGCTLSAAITACLARGKSIKESVQISKNFITYAIEQAFALGKGHGPLNHFVKPEGI